MRSTQDMGKVLGLQARSTTHCENQKNFPLLCIVLAAPTPPTHSVDHETFELRELPPFASPGLGLKV